MVSVRPCRPGDLDALYAICLETGHNGDDASALYSDPKLMGHIYAAPYAVLEPEHVLVAEDEGGVAGYIVGTFDSNAFAARLEEEWWPPLRRQYEEAERGSLTAADRMRIAAMRRPATDPAHIVAAYPAHIHMNLLPRLRGQRIGTTLLTRWVDMARAAGVSGIHLGANHANEGGIAFWTRSGFAPLETIGRTVWFGMTL